MRSLRWAVAPMIVSAALIAGCGGGGDGGNGNGNGNGAATGTVAAGEAQGDIALCIGRDTTGAQTRLIEQFNQENPEAEARLIELPEAADEQRTQMVQRLRAESAECDLLALDVVWTAEFAAQDWLREADDLVEGRRDEFIEATLESATYQDQVWAVPYNTNAGLIYYRTDQVNEAPESWQDLYDQAARNDGHVYQGARYEGLTVNFLEILYAAGGEVLSEDGESSAVDSDEAREALTFMVEGIQGDAVPRAVTTYQEEESRRAFEAGNATFMRNWPYAYSLAQESDIADDFAISSFPSFNGNEGAAVLGGYNLAVSRFTDNEQGAIALIDFLTSEDAQLELAKVGLPPVLDGIYDDEQVEQAMPFAETLRESIRQGRSRPVSPVYPQVSEAIYRNVHQALTGRQTPDEAIQQMDSDIESALETF